MTDTPRGRFAEGIKNITCFIAAGAPPEDAKAYIDQNLHTVVKAFADAWHGYEGGPDGAEPIAYPDELSELLNACGLKQL